MTDLKKEIKKLQRFREDTMKWFTNPEVKDKSALIEARRSIEIEMERFKAFERESKTKPFSMMGLAMGGRLDAHEQKKQEKRAPIEEIVEALTVQCDTFRAEWEILTAKKKKSKDEASRIDELKKYIDRHAFHIGSLEQVLRRLDNDMINPDDLDSLIESLNVYIEQFEDPDYFHDEELYEQYSLDSDAVDATYYKPNLSEEGAVIPEADTITNGNVISPDAAPKALREVPLTAVAKARAKKLAAREIEAAACGGPVRPDYPPNAPPKPQRPAMPHLAPPPLPAVGHHPSRAAPIEPGLLPHKDVLTSVWEERKQDTPKTSSPLMVLLEASWANRPKSADLVRCPRYVASNPYVQLSADSTSRVYPASDMRPEQQYTPEFFSSLALDTLVFVFYYREGTYEQLLASQELKRRNWRFHKKFGLWFQRAADGAVKTINPNFEFGSYSFFDITHDSWGLSTRTDLTFEYEFLDDDQLPNEQYSEQAIRRPVPAQ